MEHYFPPSYFAAFFWGLAVLLGMIGLGRLVALGIGGRDASAAGWGLHAVWGMAAYLLAGGCLAVFHACTDVAITLLVCLGLATLLWTTARAGWPSRAELAAWPWQTWPAFALGAFSFAASVGWQMNVAYMDDYLCYYNLCEKLLVTGSFDEPFAWRRLASLGGHTMLQGATLANTSFTNIQMFEIGLSPVIFLGLIVGFRQGALLRTRLGVFLALLAVTTPIIRFNVASHFTGVILFMGLFVTLDSLERADRRRRWLLVTGLVAAAFATLRAQNIAATGASLALYWIVWWLRDRPPLRQAIVDGLCCAGALLAALLPWMIMAQRSNQTPLFPLFNGGNSFAFNPVGLDGTFHDKFRLVVQTFKEPLLFPLLLCALALPPWKKALAAVSVIVGATLTSAVLAYGLGLAPDSATIPRYVQPLLIVAGFAALVTGGATPRRRTAAWIMAAISLFPNIERRSKEFLLRYQALGSGETALVSYPPRTIADYRKAQMLVPEGKRALICADFPYLFDHARNDLWSIDLPHGASPPPGLPFQKPPEETKQYLRRLGIEYVIYVDFETSFANYRRDTWTKLAAGQVAILKIEAPFYFDFFATVEALAASETVLGRSGILTVVQFKP